MTQNQKGSSFHHNNLYEKFESDWTILQSVSCTQGFTGRQPKLTFTFDPLFKINRVLPLIINNLHVNFESNRTKICSIYLVVAGVRVPELTLTFDPKTQNQRESPLLITNKLNNIQHQLHSFSISRPNGCSSPYLYCQWWQWGENGNSWKSSIGYRQKNLLECWVIHKRWENRSYGCQN